MKVQMINKNDDNKEQVMYLADVDWLWLGKTKQFDGVKDWVAHVCRDVTQASCINEICINDVCQALRKHGFEVIKVK